MNYPVNIICNLFFLSFGGFFAGLICLIVCSASRKKGKSFRASWTLTCLALVLGFAGLYLYLAPSPYDVNVLLLLLKNNWICFAVYLGIGLICTVFPKSVFPAIFILYFAFSMVVGISSYKRYPRITSVPVSVSKTKVVIDKIHYKPENKDAPVAITVNCYSVKNYLVLPLPQVWYKIEGVTNSIMLNRIEEKPKSIVDDLLFMVYGQPEIIELELKDRTFEPVLYNLKIKASADNVQAGLEEIL